MGGGVKVYKFRNMSCDSNIFVCQGDPVESTSQRLTQDPIVQSQRSSQHSPSQSP
jgi:hypothetical protein